MYVLYLYLDNAYLQRHFKGVMVEFASTESVMQTIKVKTRQGDIFVRRRLGDGPTVVFLHGNSFSSDIFIPLATRSIYKNCTLIMLDLPGHGRSQNAIDPCETYTFEGLANAVIDVLNILEINKAILLGWSLGGHIALDALDRSNRILGALCIGAPPLRGHVLSLLKSFHFNKVMLQAGAPKFTAKQAKQFITHTVGKTCEDMFIEDVLRVDPQLRPTLSKSITYGRFRDQYAVATSTQKPLCMIGTANDPLVNSLSTHGLLKDPNYKGFGAILASGGHAPFLNNAEDFDAIVETYLHTITSQKASDYRLDEAA